MSVHLAVDLGASSGRVMVARVTAHSVDLAEAHRFPNEPVALWQDGRPALHWDLPRLYAEILIGLRTAGRQLAEGESVASIGIDSWAVDYGLLDADGALLATPYCYRDDRTTLAAADGSTAVQRVHHVIPPEQLYRRNGLQFLPFNTLYQLAAENPARLTAASVLLLIPDLLCYWLTGAARAEITNASTTGLLHATTHDWDVDLAERLHLPASLLPPLIHPGGTIGTLLPHVAAATGLPPRTPVIAVGSHDTASAVAAVPAVGERFAYISSGTWSLVGLELPAPVLTEDSRAANFTNELGVDGRIRYLRNVMGLWMLTQSLQTWERHGAAVPLPRLLDAAAHVPDGGPLIDADDLAFLPPGDMPARIAEACRATGQRVPADQPALVRCILDSLAASYARAIRLAEDLSGHEVDIVHVVGGGSRNTLLCQLTATFTGCPVAAGPPEATAIGNALVQARATGTITGGLEELRQIVLSSTNPGVRGHVPPPGGARCR